MKKVKRKYEKIEVYCTTKQKEDIKKLKELSGKNSVSEFILDTILETKTVKENSMNDILSLFERQYSEGLTFQKEQQITTYVLVQFAMYLASENKSRDEIMTFYENAYAGSIEKFGKED